MFERILAEPSQLTTLKVYSYDASSSQASVNGTLEPGATITVPFTVETNTTAGSYTIRARNDRGFNVTYPSSVTLEAGGRAEGTVSLTAPSDTPSGTDVTLTIEAEAPGATDSNYVVISFAVATKVTLRFL